jgi:oxygen-dependent protoporphyrinogen oxidase
MSSDRIAVIGAGISGLAAAHALHRAGHDVVVIDRRPSVGGRIRSESRDGFLMEHGPNAMISPAPTADALVAELGLQPARIARGNDVRHRYLVRDARVRALSLDPLRFFSSPFFSVAGRLRLLAEPFIHADTRDESIARFVTRRFGRQLLDYVFDPLVGGLYTGDPEHLSIEAVFPQLKRLEREHGSVVRGVLKGATAGGRAFSPRRRTLFSFRDGLGMLPAALAQVLRGRLLLDTRLERLEPSVGGAFRLHLRRGGEASTMTVGSVVLALPAYAAGRILAPLDASTGAALAATLHPPVAVAFLGYERSQIAHPLDGLGVLMPAIEQRGVLGILFSSTLFAGRAPDGHVLLTAYVGGARQPELANLPREQLIALVAAEARDLLGARGNPILASVRYWRQGLPQPGVGHADLVAAVRSLEQRWPGVFITGNYLEGVSTGACIEAAAATAGRVLSQLGEFRSTASLPMTGRVAER